MNSRKHCYRFKMAQIQHVRNIYHGHIACAIEISVIANQKHHKAISKKISFTRIGPQQIDDLFFRIELLVSKRFMSSFSNRLQYFDTVIYIE